MVCAELYNSGIGKKSFFSMLFSFLSLGFDFDWHSRAKTLEREFRGVCASERSMKNENYVLKKILRDNNERL